MGSKKLLFFEPLHLFSSFYYVVCSFFIMSETKKFSNDEEYKAGKTKKDNESSISPEEDQIDDKELDDLNADAKLSIEELMAKYKADANADDDDDDDEDDDEDDDDEDEEDFTESDEDSDEDDEDDEDDDEDDDDEDDDDDSEEESNSKKRKNEDSNKSSKKS